LPGWRWALSCGVAPTANGETRALGGNGLRAGDARFTLRAIAKPE
jgi:hypothetical protein